MTGSTWTWNGGSAPGGENPSNWTVTSGPGSTKGYPQSGDTAIVPDGTVLVGLDPQFNGNTIEIGGTAGTVAALTVSGDGSTDYAMPTSDPATLISNAVPGQSTPELSVLNSGGVFVNEGTILADGPAGSVFTINIAATVTGTETVPGYFVNPGTIIAEAGNTVVVNIGTNAELFNAGLIIADGGTVRVNVAQGAIAGGDAPIRGFDLIEGGGTLETASTYPASDGNDGTHAVYVFADSIAGNTLKIDSIGSFGGIVAGFSAADTIDLGTLLAVGTLSYSNATNLLTLENASGAVLASLILGNFSTGLASGSFPVSGGSADGLTIGVGADGDTVLTTSLPQLQASGVSGAWQAAGSWLGGVVPGSNASPAIGLGATTPFILTTGSTAVSVGGFGLYSPLATVEISSNTTLTTGQVSDFAGTLDIDAGKTLTAGALQLYSSSTALTIAAGATADLTGRLNLNLAPSGGIWTAQPGGNPTGFIVSGGTAVIDGSLLAGPSGSARGGGTAIGYDSSGQSASVTVNAGGTVTDTHTTLGSTPTSSGTLTLDGVGANWTDVIDNADTYNSRGNIVVGYDDITLNTPAGLPVPGPFAAAQLVVENGAALTEQSGASIAFSANSAGNVTIETGGDWTIGAPGASTGLTVGYGGAGSLSILNGGTVAVYSGGTFLNSGTTYSLGGIGVGVLAGSSGTITVSGPGSRLSSTGSLSVGMLGQGLLAILNGGTVAINSGNVSVGQAAGPGASGTLVVGGTGTAAAALDLTSAASNLTIGASSGGIGTVTVADNGTISLNGTGFLTIGAAIGAIGDVVVGGTTASAVIDLGSDGLTVASAGIGDLTVNALGTVALTGTAAIVIGQSAGAFGTVTVDGPGASLSAAGGIDVGWLGQATLAVQSGGTVNTASLALDGQPNGPLGDMSDLVAVTTGGQLQDTGALYVWQGSTVFVDNSAGSGIDVGTSGVYTPGAVEVENGHSIVGNGLIAAAVLNSGLIDAVGTTAPNTFNAGTLEIQGSVAGSGTIDIGANAIIRLDGSVSAGQVINFTAGAAGALILNAPGTAFTNAITGLSVGDKIAFGNGMTITSASVLNGNTIAIAFNGSGGMPGTYDLTDAGFAAAGNETLSTGTDFSTGDAYIQVQPSYFGWSGSVGTDWGTPGNWFGTIVPNASDVASFTSNPGTVTGSGSALSLVIGTYNGTNTGTWTFAGTNITVAGQPGPPFLPFAVGFSANTILNGGTLNAAGGTTNIGNTGGVTVTAEGGVTVTTLGDNIGTNSGQSGSLVLTGAGTDWTELSGPAENGSTPGFLSVGFNGPSNGLGGSAGSLSVTNGASLTTEGYATLAGQSGSSGTATISSGGAWTLGNGLTVGGGGIGVLSVNGGTVNASGSAVIGANTGASGTLSVSAGTFAAAGQLMLGQSLGSFGDVSVNSGLISAAGGIQIGGGGFGFATAVATSVGAMTIGAGGTLLFGGLSNTVGGNPNSMGSLLISGGVAKSTQAPGTAQVLQIGASGRPLNPGPSSGTVDVAGAGSLLDLDGNGLSVGNQGIGGLTVEQGGTVNAGVTNSNLGSALAAGDQSGGDAAITVTGSRSVLNLGGYVSMGQGGSATLNINTNGFVNITNAATNGTGLSLGAGFSAPSNYGGEAEATVTSGGTLSDQGSLTVGGNGASGVLDVNAGGVVMVGTGLTVGTATRLNGTIYGGSGSLDIGAGGTVLITEAPQSTNFAVEIGTDNGNVGGSTGLADGNVTVSGAGALLDTNGNGLEIGREAIGTLTVSQGGSVVTGTPNSSLIGALDIGRFGTGSMVLTDPGSAVTVNGYMLVGRGGSGSLLVQNHASLSVGIDPTGEGSIGIGEANGAANSLETLVQTGGTGYAAVTTGGDLYSQLHVEVGSSGSSGTLSVNTGGTVEAGQKILIGLSETIAAGGTLISAAGTTTVSAQTLLTGQGVIDVGAGGLLKADGSGITSAGTSDIIVGDGVGTSASLNVTGTGATVNSEGYRIGIGAAGQGTLAIGLGGTVLAGTPFASDDAIYVGGSAGARGSVTISDAGSELIATGQLAVGSSGQGSLLIENQATATTGNNAVDPTQGFDVGQFVGASGTVTVTGTQSVLANIGQFIVGDAGFGSLAIQASGTVTTSAGAIIANTGTAAGSGVTITGPGSNWQIAGAVEVGNTGAGTLSISTGGTVTATDLTIGAQAGGSGTVTVSDSGSLLDLTGTLSVGTSLGVGALTIGPNATIVASRVIVTGTVVNNGGILDPTEIDLAPGSRIVGYGPVGGAGDTIVNDATIEAMAGSGGATEIITGTLVGTYGTLSGSGVLQIDSGSTLDLTGGPVDNSQSVVFAGSSGGLEIGDIAGFQADITNFGVGDTIIVDTSGPATFSLNGSVIDVIENGAIVGMLTFASPQMANTAYTTAGALVDNAMCFLAGTLITTPTGQTAVEQLAAGDLILTASGQIRPIAWVGAGRVLATRGRRNAATPVIVRKGALAPNVPFHDLRVTKGHSFFIDGVLIPVEFLVNHRSIQWDDRAQEVSIFHVELETHDVLLANGAPAESYRDDGNRWLFQNANSGWDQPLKEPCAPVLTGGAVVDAVWRRLLDRAGPRPSMPLTDDPDIHLEVDGVRVDAARRFGDALVFPLPGLPDAAPRVISRAALPQELGIARDPRCLGVAVRCVVVRQGSRFQLVRADDPALASGFHPFETATGLRWTNGDATLPETLFSGFEGPLEVVLHVEGRTQYVEPGVRLQAVA